MWSIAGQESNEDAKMSDERPAVLAAELVDTQGDTTASIAWVAAPAAARGSEI